MKICALLAGLLLLSSWAVSADITAGVADPDDWVTINKDYSSQRYVDLDQINPTNIGHLKEICEIRLNEPIMFSSGLLKVGRTLYVDTGLSTTAFDATTCQLRWRQPIDFERNQVGANNRGPAYLDGKIFRGTTDGRLIALDAESGKLLWEAPAADPAKGESFISAPIAWNGRVFIGIAISDLGIAGRLMAFAANTGNELWQFATTLGSPYGGGFWTTYSLDPNTGEVFGPVANPFPDFSRKPADKDFTKYTDSVIAVDAAGGNLLWSFQVVARDDHDFDLAAAPTLYRTSNDADGKNMVALAGKSGRVYGIDRDTRLLAFNTPATTLENDLQPLSKNWTRTCPGVNGGAQFNGAAYHPGTGALYVGMVDFCSWYANGKDFGEPFLGGLGGASVKDWSTAAELRGPRGWITAIDGKTGAVLWRYHAQSQVQAGLVPTKSGLLFAGDTRGNLLVFDTKNGSLLRSIDAGGALNSGLISYSVADAQYVAATIGGGTENPSTVAGPLRVSIYGLSGGDPPTVVTLLRLEPSPGLGQTARVKRCSWRFAPNATKQPGGVVVHHRSLAKVSWPILSCSKISWRLSHRRCRGYIPVFWSRKKRK
jgi:alcohol dehydrogenase (cytochrome c)